MIPNGSIDKLPYIPIFEKMKHCLLKMRNICLTRTVTYEFLGILIDANLKFDKHVNDLCNRLSRSIGVMTRIGQLLPRDALRSVYLAIISSRMTYGITTWGSAGVSVLSRLKSLVNKAVKKLGLPNETVANIYERNRILNFDATYKLFVLKRMHDITRDNRVERWSSL